MDGWMDGWMDDSACMHARIYCIALAMTMDDEYHNYNYDRCRLHVNVYVAHTFSDTLVLGGFCCASVLLLYVQHRLCNCAPLAPRPSRIEPVAIQKMLHYIDIPLFATASKLTGLQRARFTATYSSIKVPNSHLNP